MKFTFTIHQDAWLREGPVFASGEGQAIPRLEK